MSEPLNLSQFNYSVSVTGDCSGTSSGIISVEAFGATPPYTYFWNYPSLYNCVLTTGPCIRTGLAAGTYSVVINDSTLPTNNVFTVNIPISSGVCCSVLDVQDTTCSLFNGSVTGSTNSDFSSVNFYLLDSTSQILQQGTTDVQSIIFGNLSAGTYNLLVQDIGGCTGMSETFIVQSSSTFNFGFYIVPNSDCGSPFPQGKIYVTGQTGNPPYTYNWSNTDVDSSFVTGLTAGVYTVTVTDANGCSETKSATVTDVEPLGFGKFTTTTPTCFAADGELVLQITGGTPPYYYSASTGNVEISYLQTFTLSNISAGVYSFSVTDAGLCRLFATTSIQSPQSMASVQVKTINSTCSANDGQIQVTISQGTAPFNYTIIYPDSNTETFSTNQPIYLFTGLETGEYSIFVSDQTGCAYGQTVYLIANNTYTITTSVVDTTCGIENGSVNITKSNGGQEPYDYFLGEYEYLGMNTNSVTFTNLPSGQYMAKVVDATGCTQTQMVYVDSSPTLDFTLYPESCGSGTEGSITAFITSGTPPFTYKWSDNVPGNPQQITVQNLSAGTYSLSILDDAGCVLQRNTRITCPTLYTSYQTYTMGSENLTIDSEVPFGIQQMLNDGYQDLITGETGCTLNQTIFTAKVSVEPMGLSTSQDFYTGTTLNDFPGDNIWYDTVVALVYTVPGVGNVIADPLTNQLLIQTNPSNPMLVNQKISVELIIDYDINCL